jgi:hypothetical protein
MKQKWLPGASPENSGSQTRRVPGLLAEASREIEQTW